MNRPPLHPADQKILLALIDSGGLNSYALAHACLVSHRSIRNRIERYLLEGLISRIGSSSRAHYVVTSHGQSVLQESMEERWKTGKTTLGSQQ